MGKDIIRRAAVCAAFVMIATGIAAVARPAAADAASVRGDFNGDGYSDLAFNARDHSPQTGALSGAIDVLYGSASGGLHTSTIGHYFSPTEPGMAGPGRAAGFGFPGTSADFNNDGYADVAVGGAKGVYVIYGSPKGLSTVNSQYLTEVPKDDPAASFAAAVASGDFNGDGYADLAVGAPNGSMLALPRGGIVQIWYGSVTGVHQWQTFAQESFGGLSTANDWFGRTLIDGDFNGDHIRDLAIGAPGEHNFSGAVTIVYGSNASGLQSAGARTFTQDSAGVPDVAEHGDQFGNTLAAGDFNNDRRTDLAVGAPYEGVTHDVSDGSVTILYSALTGGLAGTGSARIVLAHPIQTYFGATLAAGQLDGHRGADLVVATTGFVPDSGTVNVYWSRLKGGLAATSDVVLRQGECPPAAAPPLCVSLALPSDPFDEFGGDITIGQFGHAGSGPQQDLAIGVPELDVNGLNQAGGVDIVYGGTAGLGNSDVAQFTQATPGVYGAPEAYDHAGGSLVP